MIMHEVHDSQSASPWTIRRATPNDLDEIVAIWFQGQVHAEKNAGVVSIEDLKDFYLPFLVSHSESFGIWIAESACDSLQNIILGWQSLLPCRSHPIYRSQWAESSTYLRQPVRVRGVGRGLITYVTDNAVHTGLSHIVGYVREDNIAMIRIVEGANWKRVGCVPCGDLPGTDRYYYVFTTVNAEPSTSPIEPSRSNA